MEESRDQVKTAHMHYGPGALYVFLFFREESEQDKDRVGAEQRAYNVDSVPESERLS